MKDDRDSSLIGIIRRDIAANEENPKGKLLLVAFRITHKFASSKQTNKLLWIVGIPIMIFYRIVFDWVLSIELPAKTKVGAGLRVDHGQSLVINPRSQIGKDCTLRQCTTLGCKIFPDGREGPSPILGDRVDVGSNVVILGAIMIGDDSIIGAGSVVVHDVPSGSIVVGNPARVIGSRHARSSVS